MRTRGAEVPIVFATAGNHLGFAVSADCLRIGEGGEVNRRKADKRGARVARLANRSGVNRCEKRGRKRPLRYGRTGERWEGTVAMLAS